jgi:hypothetical protein
MQHLAVGTIGLTVVCVYILSRVLVTKMGFGLVIRFINRLQVVTTITSNAVPDLHNLQSLHYNFLSLFPLVFTIHFLATDHNTGIITDSHFKYHCIKSLLITINTALPLFLHFMVHCYTHTSPLLVTQLTTELALQITPNITHEESLPLTLKVFNSHDQIFSNCEPSAALCTENSCKRTSVSPINP